MASGILHSRRYRSYYVVVMSKIATKKQRDRDDLAVNAEKHQVCFL
jgi:hypothetical protein